MLPPVPTTTSKGSRRWGEASASARSTLALGHPETAALLAKYSGTPVSDVLNGRVPAGVRFDPASVQIMIDAAARYTLIPQSFDAKDLIYANALH